MRTRKHTTPTESNSVPHQKMLDVGFELHNAVQIIAFCSQSISKTGYLVVEFLFLIVSPDSRHLPLGVPEGHLGQPGLSRVSSNSI